jgi:hypothetical protein
MIELIAAAVLAAAQEPQPASELGELRAYILSNRTGQYSDDISPPESGGHWNRVLEGDDIVVTQEIRTSGEQFLERPLRIVARVGRRLLAQRSNRGILTTEAGRAFQHLVVPDSTCAGDIQVTVTYGTQIRTETVALHCGE